MNKISRLIHSLFRKVAKVHYRIEGELGEVNERLTVGPLTYEYQDSPGCFNSYEVWSLWFLVWRRDDQQEYKFSFDL